MRIAFAPWSWDIERHPEPDGGRTGVREACSRSPGGPPRAGRCRPPNRSVSHSRSRSHREHRGSALRPFLVARTGSPRGRAWQGVANGPAPTPRRSVASFRHHAGGREYLDGGALERMGWSSGRIWSGIEVGEIEVPLALWWVGVMVQHMTSMLPRLMCMRWPLRRAGCMASGRC